MKALCPRLVWSPATGSDESDGERRDGAKTKALHRVVSLRRGGGSVANRSLADGGARERLGRRTHRPVSARIGPRSGAYGVLTTLKGEGRDGVCHDPCSKHGLWRTSTMVSGLTAN